MNMKPIRRRWLATTGAASLAVLVLAGCSTSGPDATSTTPASSEGIQRAIAVQEQLLANEPKTVAPLPEVPEKGLDLAVVNCTLPVCARGAQAEPAAALGWTSTDFDFDLTKGPSDFVRAVEEAIASKPDALIITAVYPESLIQDQVNAAAAEGIKIVDYGGTAELPGFVACVSCFAATGAMGEALGNMALADAGEPTSVGVILDKTNGTLMSTADGVKKAIEENGDGSKAQNVEVSFANTPAANASTVVSFLQRNPDVEYLIFTTPAFVAGVKSALDAAGLEVKIMVSSPNEDDIGLIAAGDVYQYLGTEAGAGRFWGPVDAAVRAVQNAPIEPKTPIPAMRLINADNADPSLAMPTDYQRVFEEAWGVGD